MEPESTRSRIWKTLDALRVPQIFTMGIMGLALYQFVTAGEIETLFSLQFWAVWVLAALMAYAFFGTIYYRLKRIWGPQASGTHGSSKLESDDWD